MLADNLALGTPEIKRCALRRYGTPCYLCPTENIGLEVG
jgi:hypothetical protein